MTILGLLLILGLLAAAYWLVNHKFNTPPPLRWIINTVIVVIAVWFTLDAFGVLDEVRGAKVPRV